MTSSREIENRLVRLADDIDWPRPTADLTARIVSQVHLVDQSRDPRFSWRRTAVAVAVALLIVISVLPPARQAVADLLGLAGIEITLTDELPDQLVSQLDLGERLSLERAVSEGGFVVRIPGREGLGTPDAVFLSDGAWINMIWIEAAGLVSGADGRPAVILSQFANGLAVEGIKSVSPETTIEAVTVDGQPGRWIEGAPHSLTLVDSEGLPFLESTRLAANVLLWESGGVSYRLELSGDFETAERIAKTLEPVGNANG